MEPSFLSLHRARLEGKCSKLHFVFYYPLFHCSRFSLLIYLCMVWPNTCMSVNTRLYHLFPRAEVVKFTRGNRREFGGGPSAADVILLNTCSSMQYTLTLCWVDTPYVYFRSFNVPYLYLNSVVWVCWCLSVAHIGWKQEIHYRHVASPWHLGAK